MENQKMTFSEDELADDVVDLLRELLHALLRSSVPAWLELQLTLPQLRTLFIIAHNKTSSVAQISQHLGIGEPTTSHLIEKLVQAGLVERKEDLQDRRRASVQLSHSGGELIEKLLGWEDFLGGWLHRVSRDDLALLQQGLHSIVDELHNLEAEGEESSEQ